MERPVYTGTFQTSPKVGRNPLIVTINTSEGGWGRSVSEVQEMHTEQQPQAQAKRDEDRMQQLNASLRLLTGGTGGLAGEARKRLRVAGALARRQRLGWPLIPSGTLVWPGIMQHDAEPEESQEHQLVEKE